MDPDSYYKSRIRMKMNESGSRTYMVKFSETCHGKNFFLLFCNFIVFIISFLVLGKSINILTF